MHGRDKLTPAMLKLYAESDRLIEKAQATKIMREKAKQLRIDADARFVNAMIATYGMNLKVKWLCGDCTLSIGKFSLTLTAISASP